jgi:NAD(P)-dependent dehydrogenase (short-subunit alcohol dehydrogenase family)
MMKAIVTGHSRGLGASIATELLARNIPVLGLSRRSNIELEQGFPALLEQVGLDLSDSSAVALWLAGDTLRQFLSGCESVLLINNAASLKPVGPIASQDLLAIARTVSLNVATPMMLASAVAAASPNAGDRRIVHVSSGAARNAYPGWSIYCATKAALDHHARATMLDQTAGLRICSLAPGVIDTDMQAEIRTSSPELFPLRGKFDDMKRKRELSSPAATAQRLVDYLLSEQFGQLAVADLRQLPT